MTLGSPVQSPVHLGQPPNFSNFQSPVPTGQPPLHSTMVGQGLNTPLGQSPALAGSQMQQSNPAFLPGYLMGQPQQVMEENGIIFPTIFIFSSTIFFIIKFQPTNRVMSPTKLNRSMCNMSSNQIAGLKLLGKKYALKKYDQFAPNTSCCLPRFFFLP